MGQIFEAEAVMPETRAAELCACRSLMFCGEPCSPVGREAIAAAAAALIRADGAGYAKAQAPTSPYANLSGNPLPGVSRPQWLRGQNKCNQFVGDALTAGGFVMPTVRMRDGTEHYALAEMLPRSSQFMRLGRFADIAPGDIFVRDYGAASGASGAHTEVVIARGGSSLTLAGAHRNGAGFSTFTFDPREWRYQPELQGWSNGSDTLYFLRPQAAAQLGASARRLG